MVCTICEDMLKKHANQQHYGLAFDHQPSLESLIESAKENCCICRVLLAKFKTIQPYAVLGKSMARPGKTEAVLTQASLTYNREWAAYRLDIRLNQRHNLERVGSFFLKQLPVKELTSPLPNNTSSYGNVQLARKWLNECVNNHRMCRHVSPAATWYPTRLVDMGSMAMGHVKVVQQGENDHQITGRYVTLSHCWGLRPQKVLRLTNDTLAQFEDGIKIEDLPTTFQHAMDFACRLGVRYIWIDSLCILQDSEKDWLYQSARMDQVYNNSLCNISATAASSGSEGIYADRDSKQYWVDTVVLNTGKFQEQATNRSQALVKPARQANGNVKSKLIPARSSEVPTYTILNLELWEATVDQGPVNKRGWVLQERLIAPRVLHFCHDQIAWECWEKGALESLLSLPDGMPHVQLKAGIISESRLKGMVPSVDGKLLREARLSRGRLKNGKYTDIDEHMTFNDYVPSVYTFEVWKRLVETYSKTALTNRTDKLIALAGIAKIMSRRILSGRDEDYVAGMWRPHLESQLLWHVDPAVDKEGKYLLDSKRPGIEHYRAPSFSWAAIDSERGINYADVTDFGLDVETDLLIKIETVILKYKTDDRFGMLTGGFLRLKGVLKRIIIVDSTTTSSQRQGYTRYHWQLVRNGKTLPEPYKMIYLDAPYNDQEFICGPDRRTYCLPVCFDRSPEPKELICLLLQAVGDDMPDTFRRIGLTKISRYHKKDQGEILTISGEESSIDCKWDGRIGKHTLRII
ncbi:heterokaryon incompatibility protein-domain-containing protein [Leptodontidium sp. MPI-SDFR-AT-0119]|nr:heterokaryon incompatibility protein-domain-containing protein [Leptodontidium sp. MPI-SDFR-AT-0119]